MEFIHAMLQKSFHNRRIFAERIATPLTGRVSSILLKNSTDSEIYTAESVDMFTMLRVGQKIELLILLIRPVHVVGLTSI